jgi:uncharacterized protein YecA (UPF0149 family)
MPPPMITPVPVGAVPPPGGGVAIAAAAPATAAAAATAAPTAQQPQVVRAAGPSTRTSMGAPRPGPVNMKNVGRNDPCPCGSGRKFKQCHGR